MDACTYAYISGGPPHPVIVTRSDNQYYIRVLFYSYHTTITGWVVLLTYIYMLIEYDPWKHPSVYLLQDGCIWIHPNYGSLI